MKKLFIIAGEASGDLHAASLLKELYKIIPPAHLCVQAIGGNYLEEAGARIFFNCKYLNSVGITEVIKNISLYLRIEKELMFESFDKIIISILAKKIAFGANHVVIDLPYGRTLKVTHLKDAQVLKSKFEYVAKKFNIKIRVLIHRTDEPVGRGIGPILETKDALKVLEQTPGRPFDLEVRGIDLAGNLLELCLYDSPKKQLRSFCLLT